MQQQSNRHIDYAVQITYSKCVDLYPAYCKKKNSLDLHKINKKGIHAFMEIFVIFIIHLTLNIGDFIQCVCSF